jgi:hypothetical protein
VKRRNAAERIFGDAIIFYLSTRLLAERLAGGQMLGAGVFTEARYVPDFQGPRSASQIVWSEPLLSCSCTRRCLISKPTFCNRAVKSRSGPADHIASIPSGLKALYAAVNPSVV